VNPNDYEPRRHVYRAWEGEVTLDGVDYLVAGHPTVELSPETKPDGRLGTAYDYSFEEIEVYQALGDTYDYDNPLRGTALREWRAKHEKALAECACEEQQDWAAAEREEDEEDR